MTLIRCYDCEYEITHESGGSYCCLNPPDVNGRWPELNRMLGCSQGHAVCSSYGTEAKTGYSEPNRYAKSLFDMAIPLPDNPTIDEMITWFRRVGQGLIDAEIIDGASLDVVFGSIYKANCSPDTSQITDLRSTLDELLARKTSQNTRASVLAQYLRMCLSTYDSDIESSVVIANSIPTDKEEEVEFKHYGGATCSQCDFKTTGRYSEPCKTCVSMDGHKQFRNSSK